jgi:hypothetical protein
MMRAVLGALTLAACATPVAAQDAMAPLAPLTGCWRGTFANQPDIHDDRCFEPVLDGRIVRDVHYVRPTEYAGETTYFQDGGALSFVYLNTERGVARGTILPDGERLAFPPHAYVALDGATQHLRSTWRIESADRFVVESEREENGAWVAFALITYERVPAAQ